MPAVFQEIIFNVEIVDPCLTATLKIDSTDAVFNADPTVLKLLQFVTYAAQTIEWDQTIVSKSLDPAEDPCGAHTVEIWQVDKTGTQVAIDTSVFAVQGLDGARTTVDVQTDDYGKVGIYSLRLVTYYLAYPQFQFQKDFSVEI